MHPRNGNSPGAFTLVELLVVVAIIAILASIAMLNYQESVTRARTSRALADMRTLTVAIESYHVDHNDYPPNPAIPEVGSRAPRRPRDGVSRGFNITPSRVTTPVAYITSLAHDPFREGPRNVYDIYETPHWNEKFYYNYYRIISRDEWLAMAMLAGGSHEISLIAVDAARPGTPGAGGESLYLNRGAFGKYGEWVQWAAGPDGSLWHADDDFVIPGDPLNALLEPIHPPWGYSFDVPYDPTNGTLSFGNIIRTQHGAPRPGFSDGGPDGQPRVGGGPNGGPDDRNPNGRSFLRRGFSSRLRQPRNVAGAHDAAGSSGTIAPPSDGREPHDFEELVEEKSGKKPYAHRPWWAFFFSISLRMWLLLLFLLLLFLIAFFTWLITRRRKLEEHIALRSSTLTDLDLMQIRGIKSLKRLHLAQGLITDEGLRFLSDSRAIEVLNLWGTQITDSGLAYLETMTSLRELVLTDTAVTDAGMKFVGRLGGLESLVLAGLPITDSGAVYLRALGGLKYLNIRSTLISQVGLDALRNALPGCEVIQAPTPTQVHPPGGNP